MTYDEAEIWLRASNVQLSLDLGREFPQLAKTDLHNVMVPLPSTPTKVAYFALRVIEWLPVERTRLLWLTKWHQYPLLQRLFFETVRRSCGIADSISLSPGLLVGPNQDQTFEVEYSSPQHSILGGLLLLMLSYDWQGFIVAQDCSDQIIIGDENIYFCSNDRDRISAAVELAKQYQLLPLLDRSA